MEQEVRSDSKSIQKYTDWFAVSEHNGWLVYKKELEELIQRYTDYMDNSEASGEMLKNYQLIKKGLKMALDIPKILETKAKLVRKEK